MSMSTLPFNPDQKDKILRLSLAGVDDEELARRYGVKTTSISAALKDAQETRELKQREIDAKYRGA